MRARDLGQATAAMLCVLGIAAAAQAQQAYVPKVGQAGKDVIWLPTPDDVVDRMLRSAQVTARDVVVDLGSGDGRIVIAAAKMGARAVGIEYNGDLVQLSKRAAQEAGVANKARFIRSDLFEADFRYATVLTMYLLPPLVERLQPLILAMRPGTRVVSYEFAMTGWEPDEVTEIYGSHAVYLWIVPAVVSGVWKLDAGGKRYEMLLEQKFQKISGSAEFPKSKVGLRDARLRGNEIWFTLVDEDGVRREFAGRISGKRMGGIMKPDNGPRDRFTAFW